MQVQWLVAAKNKGEILEVVGIGQDNVAYNPYPITKDEKGRSIIAARVEHKDSDWLNKIDRRFGPYDPRIQFFYEEDAKLLPLESAPIFEGLEDPFCANVIVEGKDEILFGGVRVNFKAPAGPQITTELYLASDLTSLNPDSKFATVPGMKDIRFCQSEGGDLVMLTRPTIGDAFPGSIGYCRVKLTDLSFPDLLAEKINTVVLLPFSIYGVKLGPNALYSNIINSSETGKKEIFRLICHSALADPYKNNKGEEITQDYIYGILHYKVYEGYIDPDRLYEPIELKELASKKDFPVRPEDTKGPKYEDVVFPGGILNGYLYVGVGDRKIGKIKVM